MNPLLTAATPIEPIPSLNAWRARHLTHFSHLAPMDQALHGGFAADRPAYAFAAGYQAAMYALVPTLAADRVVCLAATEEGGAHPKAIATRLQAQADGTFALQGSKRWVTAAPIADILLVVATEGRDERGRNRLRVVRVDAHAPGVCITQMPMTPFAPEMPHAELALNDVRVTAADVLPGDGYEQYVRPFRTIEDIFVHAALLGFLIRVARERSFEPALVGQLLVLSETMRGLAARDPSHPETHILLAGALDFSRRCITDLERAWGAKPDELFAIWERDRPLLAVAERARAARFATAWGRATQVATG